MFDEIIEKAIRRKRRGGGVSMSGIGHCLRRLAYQHHCHREDTKIEPEGLLAMEMGTAVHKHLQKLIKRKCPKLLTDHEKKVTLLVPVEESELVVMQWFALHGHVDGLTEDEVVDFKTCNRRRFDEFKLGKIPPDYTMQLNAYMAASGRSKARFIFICRDSGEFAEAVIYRNEETLKRIFSRVRIIFLSQNAESVVREYVPDVKTGRLPWQCGYCPFVKTCWGKTDGFKQTGKHQYSVAVKPLLKDQDTGETQSEGG